MPSSQPIRYTGYITGYTIYNSNNCITPQHVTQLLTSKFDLSKVAEAESEHVHPLKLLSRLVIEGGVDLKSTY